MHVSASRVLLRCAAPQRTPRARSPASRQRAPHRGPWTIGQIMDCSAQKGTNFFYSFQKRHICHLFPLFPFRYRYRNAWKVGSFLRNFVQIVRTEVTKVHRIFLSIHGEYSWSLVPCTPCIFCHRIRIGTLPTKFRPRALPNLRIKLSSLFIIFFIKKNK